MKLILLLKTPYDELRNYSPGHMFEVKVRGLDIQSQDPNLNGLTLDEEDLKHFKLIKEA